MVILQSGLGLLRLMLHACGARDSELDRFKQYPLVAASKEHSDAPGSLLNIGHQFGWTDFFQALLHAVDLVGAGWRVGDQLLHALAREHLVGHAIAYLLPVERDPLGRLYRGACAGGNQLLAQLRLHPLVNRPAFAAGGKGEGEREQGQKRSVHLPYVGTALAISSPISTQSW
jgi:hypothetical protein